ncbi:MAG: alcohol dehydrogenase catalytic domain-containing protein [Deltaproteobacteria bacterium]|nr:alcohol dehydrogenase catalytic domain-containing protein [Deltaproteobacteria bacterium]MBW1987203.1 alcohol dehydrogenase catalytic domain-containing protein [Deltaproteobacteria bacterium]MBW2134317.1 alcohol dehydrogenase catalytic domain-containing protein [Deltaproteobacteria bacterium]
MQALRFDGQLRLVQVPRPQPQAGEALIRVRLVGLCQTDVEITGGYKQFQGILGHEFVGRVEAASDPAWIGQRVVGEINIGCGQCLLCQRGQSKHCQQRTVLGISGRDGALAEYLTLPLANLHQVPDSVPDAVAVFTEPLAAALEILVQVPISPTSKVLIVGDGKLGLLSALALRLTGAELHLVGRHPEKMALVAALGVITHKADHFVGEEGSGPGRIFPPDFDLVVECSGAPAGWHTALAAVRPQGSIVAKSTYQQTLEFNPTLLVVPEVTVIGSRCGPFAPALRLLANGLVNPRPLISRTFPLAQAREALEYAQQPEVLKVLVEVTSDGN